MKRTKLDDRVLPVYTKGEEIFNMVTHIVGGAMGIAALVLCIIFCHDGYGLFSGIVYGISMILLYTMSAIYHGLSPKLKEDGKYYFIIKCRKSDENVYSEYSETQYQYGWKLLENKDKTLYEYLIKEKETNDGISNSLKKDESNPTVKLRLQQLSQKNNIIMDALSYYD